MCQPERLSLYLVHTMNELHSNEQDLRSKHKKKRSLTNIDKNQPKENQLDNKSFVTSIYSTYIHVPRRTTDFYSYLHRQMYRNE